MTYTDAAEIVEIIKELARYHTMTIEFANSVTRDREQPVFRVALEELDIQAEGTIEQAFRQVKNDVENYTAVFSPFSDIDYIEE